MQKEVEQHQPQTKECQASKWKTGNWVTVPSEKSTLPPTSSRLLSHPGLDAELDELSQWRMGDPDKDWKSCRQLLRRVG